MKDARWWPARDQQLLLRAALLRGGVAVEAWNEWRSTVDVDHLDPATSRLLPLLYQSLRIQGVEDRMVERCKGAYQLAWYNNRMLFHDMVEVLRTLRAAGIQTMVLKGTALILLHYRDPGLRPMGDLDLLVRPEQALAAMNLLTDLGWTRKRTKPARLTEAYVSVTKAHHFKNDAGRHCDLHWHPFGPSSHSEAEDRLWDAAVLTSMDDVPTYALNPADQLLHACVHGTQWDPDEHFHWLADAMVVLQTSPSQIGWNRLASLAYELRLTLPVADALTCLREVLAAPVPDEVLRRLRSMPVSRMERKVNEARGRSRDSMGPITAFAVQYLQRHPRSGGTSNLLRDMVAFVRLRQYLWGLDHWWQMPFQGAMMIGRRIRLVGASSLGRLWWRLRRERGSQRERSKRETPHPASSPEEFLASRLTSPLNRGALALISRAGAPEITPNRPRGRGLGAGLVSEESHHAGRGPALQGRRLVPKHLKVIIDFDGTLTAEEQQVAVLAEKSLHTLAHEILDVPLRKLADEYASTRERLLQAPHLHWWEVNGLVASYSDEGGFILNTTTLQVMLRENPDYERAVVAAFPQAEYDPVVDCTNYLFHRHTAEIEPLFRPAAREVLLTLIEHPRRTPVILTNSLGDKVRRHLGALGLGDLEEQVAVLGDTRQYDMDPGWQQTFLHPQRCCERIQVWPVDDLHNIDLRRPIYYQALLDAATGGSRLAVVADTFSLPGALPLVMGIPFFLLRTVYTPDWCADAVKAHPLGHLLDDLADLPSALDALSQEVCMSDR